MHSSRMRTACLLPVSPGMHCLVGYLVLGGVPGSGGVPGPRGCTYSLGVYLVWGVYLVLGVYLVWGVYLVPRGDVPGLGGVYLPRYSPLWTEFLTHASENITLPQTSFAGGNKKFVIGTCTSSLCHLRVFFLPD